MEDDFITYQVFTNLKCTRYDYALNFVNKGQLHFGRVVDYIAEAEKGNVGQGDMLEGVCYRGCLSKDEAAAKGLECVGGEYSDYYRRKDIKDKFICCFYSLDEQNCYFSDGKRTAWNIPESYFGEFCSEDPAMVVINRVDYFRERIAEYLMSEGLKENEDFFMHQIIYGDYDKQYAPIKWHPTELFVKSIRFARQHEWRIVISTENQSFLDKLATNHGNIEIGSLDGIATVYPYRKEKTHVTLENGIIRIHTKYADYNGIQHIPFTGLMEFLMSFVPETLITGIDGIVLDSEECIEKLDSILMQKYGIEVQRFGNKITLVCHKDNPDVIEKNESLVFDYYSHGKDFTVGLEIDSYKRTPGSEANELLGFVMFK